VNWKNISNVFGTFFLVSEKFAQARQDGGVDAVEICAISAGVARAWCEAESQEPRISEQDLISLFQSAGWDVYSED
jgi:hypothetical protein